MIQGKLGLNLTKMKVLGDVVKSGVTDIPLLARQFGVKESVMATLVKTKAWIRPKPQAQVAPKRPVIQIRPTGDEGTVSDPQ